MSSGKCSSNYYVNRQTNCVPPYTIYHDVLRRSGKKARGWREKHTQVQKAAREWEQVFTNTIPKEADVAGWTEAPAAARLPGPILRLRAWPSKTLSPTTNLSCSSQTPKDS